MRQSKICRGCGRLYTPRGWLSSKCDECRAASPGDYMKVRTMADIQAASRAQISVTKFLVGACVAVQLGMLLQGISLMSPNGADLVRWGSNYAPLTLGPEPWRLFTCMFVHVGLIHIALDMWCLFSLGELAEHLFGRVQFLMVYLLTGLAASLVSVTVHPGNSAGASGAIFGVAGALFAYLRVSGGNYRSVLRHNAGSIGSFIVYNLIFSFMIPGIDIFAHLGGLAAGIVMGALMPRTSFGVSVPWRLNARWLVYPVMALAILGGGYLVHRRAGLDSPTAYIVAGDLDGAARWYERKLARDPNNEDAVATLASLYIAQKEYPKATALLESAVKRIPHSVELELGLAACYEQAGRFGDALAVLKTAEKEHPDSAGIQTGWGEWYLAQNRPADAIPYLEKALQLDPNDADAAEELQQAQNAVRSKQPPPARSQHK